MKKFTLSLLIIAMVISLVGCSKNDNNQTNTTNLPTESISNDNTTNDIDIDLTVMSSTMVYSEVYNIVTTPDDYIGKTIKMKGNFSTYYDEATGNRYFACLIADATACCSQGIEFTLNDSYTYPDDYPEENAEITVIGTFGIYYEGDDYYCQLSNTEMNIN